MNRMVMSEKKWMKLKERNDRVRKMALVKNCIIVVLFALLVVGMILLGVRTIEAKESPTVMKTPEEIYDEKAVHF